MPLALKVVPLAAIVLLVAVASEASAQHSIRRAAHSTPYYGGGTHLAAGCSDCGSHRSHQDCNRCCSPCMKLCLPNPCVLVDKVGTALGGLRELFRCRCCYNDCRTGCTSGCSDCGGTMHGIHAPYDYPYATPPQSKPSMAPTPAKPAMPSENDAAVRKGSPSRVAAEAVRRQRYPRATSTTPTRTIQRTSYKVPVAPKATAKPRANTSRSSNPLR